MTSCPYPDANDVSGDQADSNAKIAVVDAEGTIVSVNEAWRRAAIADGYVAKGHGVGVNYFTLCHQTTGPDADYADRASTALRSVLDGNSCAQAFEYACTSITEEKWSMFIASPLAPKWPRGAVVSHVDITQFKDVEQVLKLSEERLRKRLEALPVLVAYVDKNQRYQFNNPAYEAWFGVDHGALRGKAVRDVIGPAAYQVVSPYIDATLAGSSTQFEEFLTSKDGRPVYVRGNYVPEYDPSGDVRGMFVFVQDITRERSLALRVEHQSTHDALTGLPNRMQLQRQLRTVIETTEMERPLRSLMILDLDHFKDINDTLGHPFGDKLLRAVAKRLMEYTSANDIVARLGGDEFAIVRTDTVMECRCPDWAKELIDRMEAPFRIDGNEFHISASIGIAPFRGRADNVDRLLKHADLALYSAKASGRGCYAVFEDKMWMDLMRRQEMLQALRQALQDEVLTVHYQPQVDLRTGTLTAVEALVRWCHPTCGDIEPRTFIALAESSGLIGKLGQWILWQAATQSMAWRQAGHRFTVAVNVSPMQIKRPDFLTQVRQVIAMGIEPDWLEFEITEDVLVDTDRRDRRVLEEIAGLGIRLALDDFGSGYSSLAYLKRLPVDRIKIEQSFVRDIGVDADDEAIIKAIITLGHQLGKRVVAEGVETARQTSFLLEHGCDDVQGFYIARPLTETRLTGWIDRRARARLVDFNAILTNDG